MRDSSGRSTDDTERIIRCYGDMLFRISMVMLGNEADAEDAVQETVIKYLQHTAKFSSEQHEKAWLITVVSNTCRDILRRRRRNQAADIDSLQLYAPDEASSGILEALMLIPEKFRIVLTLYYVEEYRIDEIAEMIGRTPSAVKMRLKKGRDLLEKTYRKEFI